jgi:hypothetical protein
LKYVNVNAVPGRDPRDMGMMLTQNTENDTTRGKAAGGTGLRHRMGHVGHVVHFTSCYGVMGNGHQHGTLLYKRGLAVQIRMNLVLILNRNLCSTSNCTARRVSSINCAK